MGYLCPIPFCQFQLPHQNDKIRQHYTFDHSDLICGSQDIRILHGYRKNYQMMTIFNDEPLLLEIDSNPIHCSIIVSCLTQLSAPLYCECRIISSDNTLLLTETKTIYSYQERLKSFNLNRFSIIVNMENKLDPSSRKKLHLQLNSIEKPNETLLFDLECTVCINYLKPPIYICQRGHSICENCWRQLPNCPTCQSLYTTNARNYTLEKLIVEHVKYPCNNKMQGCYFEGKIAELAVHETQCTFKRVLCPLHVEEHCNVEMARQSFHEHVEAVHSSLILRSLLQHHSYDSHKSSDCRIMFFDDNMFKLQITSQRLTIVFNVQQITEIGQSRYLYCLKFTDRSDGGKRILSVNQLCSQTISSETDNLSLPINLLQPFIGNSNNKLFFKIVLEKS